MLMIYFKEIDLRVSKICSDKYFWSGYFDKYNLRIPIKNYNDDWVDIFKKNKYANDFALECIDKSIGCIAIREISPIDKYLIKNGDVDKRFLKFMNDLKLENPNLEIKFDVDIMKNDDDEYTYYLYIEYDGRTRHYINTKIKKTKLSGSSNDIIYPLIYNNFRMFYR